MPPCLHLVGRAEQGVEQPALEDDALSEPCFERGVDGLLGHHGHRLGLPGDRLGDRERLFEEGFRGHHAGDQPGPLRFRGVHHPAREHQVHRLRLPHGPREPLRTAHAGDDAEVDLGLTELRVLGGDQQIAHHRQFAAAAQRVAGHRRDHGDPHPGELLPAAEPIGPVHFEMILGRHLLDVRTGGERLGRPREDHGAGAGIRIRRPDGLHHLGHGRQVQRIERLRPVEGHDRDAPTALHQDVLHGCLLLRHRRLRNGECGLTAAVSGSGGMASRIRGPGPRRPSRRVRTERSRRRRVQG